MRNAFNISVLILALSAQTAVAQQYKFCRAYSDGTMYLSALFQSDVSHVTLRKAFGEFVEKTYNVSDLSSLQCYYFSNRRDAAYSYPDGKDTRYRWEKTGWRGGTQPARVSREQVSVNRTTTPTKAPRPQGEETTAAVVEERRLAMEVIVAEQIRAQSEALQKLFQQRMAEIRRRRAACKAGDRDACRVDMRKSGASKQ